MKDHTQSFNQHTVLLVEDDKLIQQIELCLLRQNGLCVDTAMDGQEALNKIGEHVYCLVFMDLGLPDQDGLTVTRQLRKRYSSFQLPIVALTAHNSKETEAACIQAGMNGFICKPLTQEKLNCILQQYV